MPSYSNINGVRRGLEIVSKSMQELRLDTVNSSKEMQKMTKEIEKLNKHNEEMKAKEVEKLVRDPSPLIEYQPNEMTFSQLMLRKLDIL